MFHDPDTEGSVMNRMVMVIGGRREESIDPMVDEDIAEMRQMLLEMQAIDTATALRSLRRAFPHAPLAQRVWALAGNAAGS